MGLGYDPQIDSKRRHYRRYYQTELEEVTELIEESPFEEYPIKRGQSRGLSPSLFGSDRKDESGQVSNIKAVGTYKGLMQITPAHEKKKNLEENKQRWAKIKNLIQQDPNNGPPKSSQNNPNLEENKRMFKVLKIKSGFHKYSKLSRSLLKAETCIIRLYIIDAFGT